MNTTHRTPFSTQAAALGLALLATLATLGSLDSLATSQSAATEMAAANSATTQQVVIVGKRAPRA